MMQLHDNLTTSVCLSILASDMTDNLQTIIAANLVQLRQERGWTQGKLAKTAGLSRQAYVAIESGKVKPQSETLYDLAEALGSHVEDLLAPGPSLAGARFRSFKRLRTRSQIIAEVARRLQGYNHLEDILGDHVAYKFANFKLNPERDGRELATKAAVQARQALNLEPDEPIRDICGLLESAGIKILTLAMASEDFFGLSVAANGGGPAVVVNNWERISVERRIFTAAHELGHLLLHGDAYRLEEAEEQKQEEMEANTFASYFLMPEKVFSKEWRDASGLPLLDRVYKVKRMFRVSYKTVLYRVGQHADVGQAIWAKFNWAYNSQNRKSLQKTEEPFPIDGDEFRRSFPEANRAREPETLSPVDFAEDRLYSLVRRGLEQGRVSVSRSAEILGLDLVEMRSLAASWVGDAESGGQPSCR